MPTAPHCGSPASNPAPVSDDAYAAMCVWEELLSIREREDENRAGLLSLWNTTGTHGMRATAFAIGRFVNAVWNALDEDARAEFAPFDWEFVPALLQTIDFDCLYLNLPRVETAIETMRERELARAVEQRRCGRLPKADVPSGSVSSWACAGDRLFLVAYEGADGKPYALALSDHDVAARIASRRAGEVIDTFVDTHADMAAAIADAEA